MLPEKSKGDKAIMMDLQTVSEEIAKLEAQKPSYAVCAKLADLYIVKENLMKKQSGSYANYGRGNYENYGRGRENYERENYARSGGRGGNYGFDDYEYNYRVMEDDMEMRSPRMSMPSMR